jgi:hypothetical protein
MAATLVIESGCISDRAAQQMGDAIASPLNVMARSISGAQTLAHATAAFYRKTGRWPRDYAELSDFVQHSDGYLILGEYERVEFSGLPQNGLKVAFVPLGQTNLVSFAFTQKDTATK